MSDHERDWHSEVDGYPEQLPLEEIMYPSIGMEEITTIHGLIMVNLRRKARTRVSDTKSHRHGLAMLNIGASDADYSNVYDGSIDQYMTCQVRKPNFNQWRMVVRFVETLNTEETKLHNVQEHYMFDWLKNGNCAAWYMLSRHQSFSDYSERVFEEVSPITKEMCIDLHHRMQDHATENTQRR